MFTEYRKTLINNCCVVVDGNDNLFMHTVDLVDATEIATVSLKTFLDFHGFRVKRELVKWGKEVHTLDLLTRDQVVIVLEQLEVGSRELKRTFGIHTPSVHSKPKLNTGVKLRKDIRDRLNRYCQDKNETSTVINNIIGNFLKSQGY
jgi:hypothetical protein